MSTRRLLIRISVGQALGTVLVVAIAFAFREHAAGRAGLVGPFLLALLAPTGAFLVLASRPLAATDEGRLAAAYRVRFFVGLALAHSPALFGAAGLLATGRTWLLALGALLSALLFVRNAPLDANLARDERRRRERGGEVSLGDALDRTPDETG